MTWRNETLRTRNRRRLAPSNCPIRTAVDGWKRLFVHRICPPVFLTDHGRRTCCGCGGCGEVGEVGEVGEGGEVGVGGGSAGEGCVCPVYSMVRMTGRPSSGGGGAGQGRPRPLPRRNRSVLQLYYGLRRRRRRRPKIDSLLLKYRCWCL